MNISPGLRYGGGFFIVSGSGIWFHAKSAKKIIRRNAGFFASVAPLRSLREIVAA